jgi:hypothetical protein
MNISRISSHVAVGRNPTCIFAAKEQAIRKAPASASEDFSSFERNLDSTLCFLVCRRHRSGNIQGSEKNKHDPRKSFPQICNCNKSNIKNWFAVTEERCTIMAELKMTAL